MTSQGEDAPQEMLQPGVHSLLVPKVPKQHAEKAYTPWANTLQLRDHRGGLLPDGCNGPELRKASGSLRGLRKEQKLRCLLRLGKHDCSPPWRERYRRGGSSTHHSMETQRRGRARSGQLGRRLPPQPGPCCHSREAAPSHRC